MDNKKMNIAIVFEGVLENGGGYQQQLSTILALSKNIKYNFLVIVNNNQSKDVLEGYGIKAEIFYEKKIYKLERLLKKNKFIQKKISNRYKIYGFERILLKNNIDLVYFLSPSIKALELLTHNYIITVWDLCHRDYMEFPEVNYFNEFENREYFYERALKKAIAVLTDSKLGKENVIQRYGINEDRIFPVFFKPSENVKDAKNIDVKLKYEIKGDYIYYPAQFWAHKNHVYIIDALKILSEKRIEIVAIFSGANKGNLNYVLNYAKEKDIDHLIKYIGFAPNEEIYSLYKNSLALVMPTYFGPTNIPPLEAFEIGTPVIYPNLIGLREQVGEAALLCDLNNPNSLANYLIGLKSNEIDKQELILKGRLRLKELDENSLFSILESIFDNYEKKLKCWK